jgi:Flp pilus assembly protein TadG
MTTKRQKKKIFFRENAGVAAIEFAIALPLLVFLIIGVVEVSRFITTHQRIDKVSAQMADIISQTPQPKTLDADSAALRQTFEQLLGSTASTDSGFVFSVIQRETAEDQPTITYQSAMNGVSSDLGGEGTTVDDADLGGITVRPRDTIIVVESRITHENLFGDLLSSYNFDGNAVDNFDGDELYKMAVYRYRFDQELEDVNASPQNIGDIPPVCGYYRDAEDNQTIADPINDAIPTSQQDSSRNRGSNYRPTRDNDNKTWNFRDYNIYLPSEDAPHPCQCYSQGRRNSLNQRLKTCVPELITAYGCPQRGTGNNTGNIKCCDSPLTTARDRVCNGCYNSLDVLEPATNPNDPQCCTGCQCTNSCPPPPPPPPCQGCQCTNSCPPPPCRGCACTNSCPPPPPPAPPILGS